MNTPSALPKYLSEEQVHAIEELIGTLEILPLSCLFWRHDRNLRGIRQNRSIPDDFFYILTMGTLDCVVGGEARRIEAGEFVMVPAGVRHSLTPAEGVDRFDVYSLHMHLYDATRHRFLQKLKSPFGSLSDLEGWTSRLSVCTCMMGRNPEVGGALMVQLVSLLLMETIWGGQGLRELPTEIDPRLQGLLAEIRVSPSACWTVARMAEYCHLSVSRFRELFVATTGTSPKKYVQKVRLSLARSLLMTQPELTVEQVAGRVGISDAHYFHAIYKERFAETPRQRTPGV